MTPHRILVATLALTAAAAFAPLASHAQEEAALSDSTRPRPFVPPATIEELEQRIRQLLDSTKTPGAGLAVVRHDSVILTQGFGKSRLEPARPATASTLFRIGSTSKAFVALAALQLQREGKLSLQDPIRKHLPDFWYSNPWEDTDPIRIVHLLEHTSGFDDNSLRTYASSDPTPLTLEQGLALDTTTRVSRWRPGTRFSYCNTGPAIVALIIERIEGKPFEQVAQERLFDPIGMRTATYLYPDTTRVEMTELYDGEKPLPYWHIFIRPAGAINASAYDMAQYVRFLLGRGTIDGKTIVAREDIERMERSETWIGTRVGLDAGYGLHLYRTADTTGFVWTGHNGGVEGGLSDMSYLPDAGVGYALQINSGNSSVLTGLARLVRGYLTRDLPRPAEPPVGHVPDEVAAEFAGWYRSVSPRQQHLYFLERIASLMRVSFAGDSMRLRQVLGRPMQFVAVDSLRFRRPGEIMATLAFHRDEANNRPHALETSGVGATRVPGVVAVAEIVLSVAWLAAVVVGFVALVLMALGALVRRLRKRPRRPSAARPLWQALIVSSLVLLAPVLAVMLGGAGIQQLGTLTMVSGTLYGAGLLFAAWAVFGFALALRRRQATSRWGTLSLWTARGLLALHLIAAAYMVYWGPIGWKTWG
ncbi:MAG TPA: serine hydrolase domain-containing protein [Gemmatimonadaceae bacterium]